MFRLLMLLLIGSLGACTTTTTTTRATYTLEEVYYDRLPQLPGPYEVVEISYADWSARPDKGLLRPYSGLHCRAASELYALLCADSRALQAFRAERLALFFRGKKVLWKMRFRYTYTDRSGLGGNRHVYVLRYEPPPQFYYPPRGLEHEPLYRYHKPRGKAVIN